MAQTETTTGFTVPVATLDGDMFYLEEPWAKQLEVLIPNLGRQLTNPIKLQVHTDVFEDILRWVAYHSVKGKTVIKLPLKTTLYQMNLCKFDLNFVENRSFHGLIELGESAMYLIVPDLISLCLVKLASLLKGKNKSEIRGVFGIKKEFSEQQREHLRKLYTFLAEEEKMQKTERLDDDDAVRNAIREKMESFTAKVQSTK